MDEGPSGARGYAALIGEAIDRFTPLLWLVVAFAAVCTIVATLAPAIQALLLAAIFCMVVVLPAGWLLDQLRRRAWRRTRVAAAGVGVLATLGTAVVVAMTLLARFFS